MVSVGRRSADVLHLDNVGHLLAPLEEGVHVLRRDEEELAVGLRLAELHESVDGDLAISVVHVDVKLVERSEGRRAKLPHRELKGEGGERALAAAQAARVLRRRARLVLRVALDGECELLLRVVEFEVARVRLAREPHVEVLSRLHALLLDLLDEELVALAEGCVLGVARLLDVLNVEQPFLEHLLRLRHPLTQLLDRLAAVLARRLLLALVDLGQLLLDVIDAAPLLVIDALAHGLLDLRRQPAQLIGHALHGRRGRVVQLALLLCRLLERAHLVVHLALGSRQLHNLRRLGFLHLLQLVELRLDLRRLVEDRLQLRLHLGRLALRLLRALRHRGLPLHHLAQLVGDLLQALVRRARRVLRLQLASRVRQRLHLLARLVRLLLAARLGRLRLLCRLLQRRRLLPRLAHLVLGELDGLLEVLDDLVAVGAQQAFGGILVLHRLGAALAILRTLDCKRLETLRVVASKRLQPGMAAQLAKHLGLGFLEVSEEQRLRALPLVADQVVHGVALDVEEVDQARSVRLRPSTQVFEPRLGLSHEDAHVGLEACTLVLLGGQLVEQAAQHLLVGVRRHDEACKTHVAPHCPLCRMRHVLVLILDLEQRPQRALRLLLEAGLVLADQLNQQRHVEVQLLELVVAGRLRLIE
mmetsp:Transcript_44205/g.122525  ORF Transcript_44205/g.122525 Transcript_44205/m.122525 type:complete len:644 (+) Transcript_44205:522-2453(+)